MSSPKTNSETTHNIKDYPVVTICGSMRYYDKMLIVASLLTTQGHIVLMPFVKKGMGSADITMLDDMHKRKIDMAEKIIIVGMHVGESTQSEINYAEKKGIPVYWWTDHFGAIQ